MLSIIRKGIPTVLSDLLFEPSAERQAEILTAIQAAVKNGSPIHDSYLPVTTQFKAKVRNWKEKDTNLNLLQLAVINRNAQAVRVLVNKYSFDYGPKEKCRLIDSPCQNPQHSSRGKIDETFVDLNSALHISCKLGYLEVIKSFFSAAESSSRHPRQQCLEMLEARSVFQFTSCRGCKNSNVDEPPYQDSVLQFENKRHPSDDPMLEQQGDLLVKLGKTPLDICVEEDHLDCCLFLAQVYKKCFGVAKVLNIACQLKWPLFLEHLLQNDCYKAEVNALSTDGCPLIWHTTNCKGSLEALLNAGANPNVMVKGRPLLHALILKSNIFHGAANGFYFLEALRLLTQYNISVNQCDRDGSTALDVLLRHYWSRRVKSVNILKECLTFLLKHGAQVEVRCRQRNVVLRTVADTFLRDTLGSTPCVNLKVVHTVISLLFEYGGLDANTIPKNRNNLLASLLVDYKWMYRLDHHDQWSLLHLLFINGANFNKIPLPYYTPPNGRFDFKVMGYTELPIVLAFLKMYHIEVLKNMLNLMSIDAVNKCWARLKDFERQRKDYALTVMFMRLSYRVRTLSHLCKLKVISCVGKQGRIKVNSLLLPDAVRDYLLSSEFCYLSD